MLLQKGFVLVSEAADLYAATKIEFLEDLQSSYPATHGSIFVPSKEQSISTRRGWACLLASSLSVIQVPVRLRDVSVGSSRREDWGLAFLPNPVSMTSLALEHHLAGFYSIYNALNTSTERYGLISADDYATLKSLVPADTTALIDFHLTQVGVRSRVLTGLGITASRAASVNKRFTELVSETAPRIRERITARLASRRGVSISDISGNSIRAAMRRATKSHNLLKNTLLAAAAQTRCVSSQMPDLRVILQQAARVAGGISKTGCEGSYGTPTDVIILEGAWGSSGGLIDRMTLIAQHYLAQHGLSRERSAIRLALREYEIRFSRVKHTLTPLQLEQYYCAHRIQVQKQFAALFSAYCRRGSCDASKLFRCDALSNHGGAMTMTIEADTVQGPDHDCGGDHKSKLGAYGVYFEPSLSGDLDPTFGLFPSGFDAAKSVKGWTTASCTMPRDGLVCVLGHVERLGGETAARNWSKNSALRTQCMHGVNQR